MKFRLHDSHAEAFETVSESGRKQYWLRLHAVRGWKTEVRIAKRMYEQLTLAQESGEIACQIEGCNCKVAPKNP